MKENLIQARYIFEKATILWEPYRNTTNGLVVGLLQDSAELVLWAIVKAKSIDVKSKDGFVALLDKASSEESPIQGKGQILELNTARVSYKHYGISPASSDIPRMIEGTRYFIVENVRTFLGMDFEKISLADDVDDEKVRSHIKESERYRDEGDFGESLIHISLAFQRIEYILEQSQYRDAPYTSDAYRLFPKENQEDARMLIREIRAFFERFGSEHVMVMYGVSQAVYREIRRRKMNVVLSESGNRLGLYMNDKTESSKENVNFLITNITDIARRVPAGVQAIPR